MQDPFFERTVVLLWHHDDDGAIGVVVNRSLGHSLPDVVALDQQVDLSTYEDNEVGWGGPVEATSGTVVSRAAVKEDEGWNIQTRLGVTRSQDALQRLLGERKQVLLCLGYAGWGPGQLDKEIQQGGWLWTDIDATLIFDIPVEDRYDAALATLGLTTATVWMQPIDE